MTVANQARIYMKPIAERWTKKKTIKGQRQKTGKIMSAIRQTMTLERATRNGEGVERKIEGRSGVDLNADGGRWRTWTSLKTHLHAGWAVSQDIWPGKDGSG